MYEEQRIVGAEMLIVEQRRHLRQQDKGSYFEAIYIPIAEPPMVVVRVTSGWKWDNGAERSVVATVARTTKDAWRAAIKACDEWEASFPDDPEFEIERREGENVPF